MSPIRVGIIGLTATPGSWAPRAHLPYLLKSDHYTIHGVCNSSLESSKAAIAAHKLPSSTRAYDSPKALAADPDIDLVVVSTRVDTHYALTKPALKAGKNIFVEWPLGANGDQAQELNALAKEKGVKTVIGLQARMSPTIHKIKDIVASGRIGKPLSVSVQATSSNITTSSSEKYSYFANKEVGGNMLTIMAMHLLDAIFFVHGELRSYTPLLANQIPYIDVNLENGTVERRKKNTPDQVIISGRFDEGPSSDAVLSFHMRGGSKIKELPGLTWRVYGDKGELEIVSDSPAVQLGFPLSVKVFEHANGTAEEVVKGNELDEGLWTELPGPARNIGRIYEAYALDQTTGDWDLAIKRHAFVEKAYAEGGM